MKAQQITAISEMTAGGSALQQVEIPAPAPGYGKI